MPFLILRYQDRTFRIPVTAEWTGKLSPHLYFKDGVLSRGAQIDVTEARCAACGDPADLTVTKTVGVKAE